MSLFATKPVHLVELLLVGVTVQYSGIPGAVSPLGASAKRAVSFLKEQITDDSHLFQDAISSVSFWIWSFPVLG